MAYHNELGRSGEAQAAFHLYTHGYEIIERNYDHPAGQIDIIAREKDTFVFVEVKTRESAGYGSPEAQFMRDRTQQRRIVRSAVLWLKRRGGHSAARFDLVCIDGGELRHHKNAFTDEGVFY